MTLENIQDMSAKEVQDVIAKKQTELYELVEHLNDKSEHNTLLFLATGAQDAANPNIVYAGASAYGHDGNLAQLLSNLEPLGSTLTTYLLEIFEGDK